MGRFLVDTTVFVSHLRGYNPATEFLKENKDVYLSYVTVGELIQGAKNKGDLGVIKDLISAFEIDWGSSEINHLATGLLEKYYLRRGICFLDALIAATAIVSKSVLVTDNLKHFKYISGLSSALPSSAPLGLP